MFKIYDGRSHFYQWDIDRKLIVEDASISEVHFCNQTDNYSLVCKTYIEDGLNLVNVPNILLQNDWRINVYAYDSNYTKFSEQFDVIRRCKPEDYVYTETEILNYNTLSDRITKIEEGGGITPTIGDNGNWYLGSTDTGKPSRGEKGEKGETGAQGEKGATGATGADGKSAYSYAQDGGYTGTEAEFAAKLAAESIDKALYVINATIDFDSFELSVDKTFEEIKQAYDEGKYSIVLSLMGASTAPLIGMTSEVCIFARVSATQQDIVSVTVDTVKITKDNVIETYSADLTTTDSTLPNPYPLTFTGAVNETYDGSSAKTIEIPSGGGGSAWHTIGTQKMDGVETAVSFDLNGETIIQIIVTANWGEALTATKATVSLNLENGTTVDFTPQTMNASSYSPKNIFTIFGNSKQCRQMIFSKAEGAAYSSVQGSFGVAYGYDYSSEHMVEDKIATGITITFDKAPSNAAVVKVEGM